ncbi:MAG: ABC transporter permease [Bacteroidales bacterium]|nr:ABC transporter permease [Bacteroidales bacterium]MCI2134350.1 ABC transporter permease [Bacteroidales bacterium]
MEKFKSYLKIWCADFWHILNHELRQVLHDSGVMLIFVVAGLLYPLLYNLVYLNGIVHETPIAVVDNADCSDTHRIIRELDATKEVSVAYKCMNMEEAKRLMQERKVKGIIMFPSDFGKKLAHMETATFSAYADMSSFLYYKNVMSAANFVMLHEVGEIQMVRYSSMGMTDQAAFESTKPILYDDNNPYNRSFSYSYFLVSAILLIIIQQTMFYGMSLLAGTQREQNRSFASIPYDLQGGSGVGRIVLGRAGAYWLIYMAIGTYIAFIVPAIFGLPQRGDFKDVFAMLVFFVTDCVLFSMTWSTLITRRESVFVLFLAMSPVCLFLSGCSWPTCAFPKFWKFFSYLFPSTFGCQAYLNMSVAGGDMSEATVQMSGMILQTIIYFFTASMCMLGENWVIRHKERIKEIRDANAKKLGIDRAEDARIIAGE